MRFLVAKGFLIFIIFALVAQSATAKMGIGIGTELLGEVPQLIGTVRFGAFGGKLGIGKMKSALVFSGDGKLYFPLGKFTPFNFYIGAGIVIVQASQSFSGLNAMGGLELQLHPFGFILTPFAGLNYMDFGMVEMKEIRRLGTHIGVILEL